MEREARRILDVFKARRLRPEGFIHWSDFGDAIIWENGGIPDEKVRAAIGYLTGKGYLAEANLGLVLTDKGYAEAQGRPSAKDLVTADHWVDCWICEDMFHRRRETKRYCNHCERGFCEGEHGSFSSGVGTCIVCGARKAERVE